MKKIFVFGVVVIIFGVVMTGSGAATTLDPEIISEAISNGIVSCRMDSNASFIAPILVFYKVNPVHTLAFEQDFHTTRWMVYSEG